MRLQYFALHRTVPVDKNKPGAYLQNADGPGFAIHRCESVKPSSSPSQRIELMTLKIHDIGVSRLIGRYSDSVEVSGNVRWLYTSGTPGLDLDGTLPRDITGQAEIAWQHITSMLTKVGMTVRDLVKVTQYLLR